MVIMFSDVVNRETLAHLSADLQRGQVLDESSSIIAEALRSHPLFLLAVEPRAQSQPVFCRYVEGPGAPATIAEAFPRGREGFRADVGVIVFVNDASEYKGGELMIDTGWGEQQIRGEAGDCAIYPASAKRRMAAVERGVCWTAEFWAQSLVADPSRREILYDIGYSVHLLGIFGSERADEALTLAGCHQNLLRLWAGT